MSTDAEAGGGPHPPGISVNPSTGVVTWNNVGLDQPRFWTTQVVIEDLDAQGAVKSIAAVDFLLKIVPQVGVPPTCTLNPAGPFVVEPGQLVTFAVTATDPDPGNIILASSGVPPGATMTPALPLSGPSGVSSTFNWTPTALGATVVNFSATDTAGNQGLCSTTIDVVDPNEPPTIACPPSVTIPCAGPGGTPHALTVHVEDQDGDPLEVRWVIGASVVRTDSVPAGGPPTSADITDTRNYPLGPTTVTVTVDDLQGPLKKRVSGGSLATASCSTTVTVVDNTPPAVVCTVASGLLWPPNHNMVNVGLTATSSDSCSGPGGPAAVAVFGDEDDEDDTGDGRHAPDAAAIANQTLLLRSEREGDQDGRVYLIISRATDGGGNPGHNCCTVVVPQNMSPQSRQNVEAQAAAARAVCMATGAAPTGYHVIGDGPVYGPKQNTRSRNTVESSPRARGTSRTEGAPRSRNRQ
jgi:hypothetical protein